MSKNFSVNEHISRLNNKFKQTSDMNNIGNSTYYFSTKDPLIKFLAYLNFTKKDYVVINANVIQKMKNEKFIGDKKQVILLYQKNNSIKNLSTNNEFKIGEDSVFYDNFNDNVIFDTTILSKFLLNGKTINHFSYMVFTEKDTFYILKRSNIYAIFALK